MLSAIVLLVIIVAVVLIMRQVGVPANIINIVWIAVGALVAIFVIKYLIMDAGAPLHF